MVDLIGVIRLLVYLFFILFVIKAMFNYVIKKRNNKNIDSDRLNIIVNGKPNVKKLHLGSLWLSDKGDKRTKAGNIISYVKAGVEIEGKEKILNCFVIKRKRFEPPEFYLIPNNEIKDNLIKGDVICTLWNFRLDENSSFHIPNEIKNIVIDSVAEDASVGVDTLKKVAPLVDASIRANPVHRIRMRETGLIR